MTTRRDPAGWVRMVRTSVMVTGMGVSLQKGMRGSPSGSLSGASRPGSLRGAAFVSGARPAVLARVRQAAVSCLARARQAAVSCLERARQAAVSCLERAAEEDGVQEQAVGAVPEGPEIRVVREEDDGAIPLPAGDQRRPCRPVRRGASARRSRSAAATTCTGPPWRPAWRKGWKKISWLRNRGVRSP